MNNKYILGVVKTCVFSAEKGLLKGYVFKDCKLIRTFGLFVTVKDHDTHQIHMADFIDNYSTSRQALDVFIEKLFRLAPYQIQDVMDDAKRERELEEMELLLAKETSEQL